MALGNAYLATGTPSRNGTPLFHLLMSPSDDLDHGRYKGMSIRRLEVVLAAVGHAMDDLDSISAHPTTDLAVAELRWIARAIALAGRVGIERFGIGPSEPLNILPAETRDQLGRSLEDLAEDQSSLWNARYRPGGLKDSLARFDELRCLLSV